MSAGTDRAQAVRDRLRRAEGIRDEAWRIINDTAAVAAQVPVHEADDIEGRHRRVFAHDYAKQALDLLRDAEIDLADSLVDQARELETDFLRTVVDRDKAERRMFPAKRGAQDKQARDLRLYIAVKRLRDADLGLSIAAAIRAALSADPAMSRAYGGGLDPRAMLRAYRRGEQRAKVGQ